jgi:acyl carrier protein
MDTLRERVSRVIAEQFHLPSERITEAATLDEDLGATSIDRVEVVMALEDEFKIDISDDQALRMHTVADVLTCVAESIAQAKKRNEGTAGPSATAGRDA